MAENGKKANKEVAIAGYTTQELLEFMGDDGGNADQRDVEQDVEEERQEQNRDYNLTKLVLTIALSVKKHGKLIQHFMTEQQKDRKPNSVEPNAGDVRKAVAKENKEGKETTEAKEQDKDDGEIGDGQSKKEDKAGSSEYDRPRNKYRGSGRRKRWKRKRRKVL